MPEELMNRLHEAVLSADLDRMLELIDQIELLDPATAGSLRDLAENFEYRKLLEITARTEEEGKK